MSWLDIHNKAQNLAARAGQERARGEQGLAQTLSLEAAKLEERALSEVDRSKTRTLSIFAVSAVSLYFKAGAYDKTESLARLCLQGEPLRLWARNELRGILSDIHKQQKVET